MKITLSNMEFHAFIGCLQHEKTLGNQFAVSVTMFFDGTKAQQSDNLEDTINYQQIFDIVKTEMSHSCNLIENAAYRIINTLKTNVLSVDKWEVELSKLNPPLGSKSEKVTVSIER
ncbi:MAG: dihydroneopterin aldolase [Paludibacter sp.]|nr:dihydroneopterin aldolase [Paludibacter sp.]